ncbi:MAG: hypothetical protein JSV09_12200 [Thermoplasmata archaeon]|nr:MAG: hypothetical protein JSV09_12200 [Thermoplasmata archaeon]
MSYGCSFLMFIEREKEASPFLVAGETLKEKFGIDVAAGEEGLSCFIDGEDFYIELGLDTYTHLSGIGQYQVLDLVCPDFYFDARDEHGRNNYNAFLYILGSLLEGLPVYHGFGLHELDLDHLIQQQDKPRWQEVLFPLNFYSWKYFEERPEEWKKSPHGKVKELKTGILYQISRDMFSGARSIGDDEEPDFRYHDEELKGEIKNHFKKNLWCDIS